MRNAIPIASLTLALGLLACKPPEVPDSCEEIAAQIDALRADVARTGIPNLGFTRVPPLVKLNQANYLQEQYYNLGCDTE